MYNNNNIRIARTGSLYHAALYGALLSDLKTAYAAYYTQGGGVFRSTSVYDFTIKDFVVLTATSGSDALGCFKINNYWGDAVTDTDVLHGEFFWGA